jgi:low temperature requirement protein LtrA
MNAWPAMIFAGAYVAIQIGRGLFLVLAMRARELQRRSARALFWAGLSAVPWIAGALTHGTARGALWTLAVALDYAAFALGFPTPRLGRESTSELPVVAEHLAERYRQFFIIALGELILVTGLALSGTGFAAARTAAFVVSIATTVLLWRIYIYRAGELLSAAIAAAPNPARIARSASTAHLVMVAGVVVTAVGDELVIANPLGHTPPAWIAVILGGPALFLPGAPASSTRSSPAYPGTGRSGCSYWPPWPRRCSSYRPCWSGSPSPTRPGPEDTQPSCRRRQADRHDR